MGIIIPETCWAVSVRQSNKILQLIVASSWVFYLSVKIALAGLLNIRTTRRKWEWIYPNPLSGVEYHLGYSSKLFFFLRERLAVPCLEILRTSTVPDIYQLTRMRYFTPNKMVHPILPLRWHEQHWLNFSRPMDNRTGMSTPTLTWINPAWLSLVDVFKGCDVSYKGSNTGIITGRNWRVVRSQPSTHHDWYLPLVCWIQQCLDMNGENFEHLSWFSRFHEPFSLWTPNIDLQ